MTSPAPSRDGGSVIETAGLTKHYGKTVAVDDISFAVEPGQIFGFLGPNGSGKTTTIGVLLGIITPTAGSFRLFGGGTPDELHQARRRIGATLEYPNFYPYLSGRDNLRIVANVKGRTTEDIDRVLDLVGLSARKKQAFRKYSLGMKQRLALAATMIGDPELIILDEPANGLDPEGMQEIRRIIKQLGEQGKTIFLSSHLLWEVERTCTHVAIIKKGHLLRTASVREITSGNVFVGLRAADQDKLRAIVSEHPEAISVSTDGDTIVVEMAKPDLASLNRYVVERGVYLSHLAERPRTLEDAFMELTAGGAHGMGVVP